MKKFLIVLMALLVFGIPSALFAADERVGLEWDPNSETNLGGYGAYKSNTQGGPYTKFADIPAGTEEVWHDYVVPDGQTTTTYFVVDAHDDGDPPLRSSYSNEVFWVSDFSPIVAPIELTASLEADVITFTWKQSDIERVKSWRLFMKDAAGGDFAELALIEYSGTPGDQYSTTETMTVKAGTMKKFDFVIVAFTPTGVFSENSNQVSVTIDKRVFPPVMNLKIKVVSE